MFKYLTHLRTAWPLVGLLALVSLGALTLTTLSPALDQPVTGALINLILVVGLYIFVGNSGVLSFGHVTFMAIGAYVCGLLTIPTIARGVLIPDVPSFIPAMAMGTVPALLIGAVIAAGVGLLVGIPIVRLNGLSAGLAMFAVLLTANVVFTAWQPGPGGGGTLTRVPTDSSVGNTLAWALGAIVVAYLFQGSRWGIRLRGSREDEPAARSLGVSVMPERLYAMVLSAFITGIGGGLYAHYVGSFTPDDFFISITFVLLAMLVVGGINSLAGAVIGTLVISAITYVFSQWANDQPVGPITLKVPSGTSQLVVSVVMVAVLLIRPDGITRGHELTWPRRMPRLSRIPRLIRLRERESQSSV